MDIQGYGAVRHDGSVEGGDDLSGELHALHGAHVVGDVVRKAPFVGVGESPELEERVVVEESVVVDCCVVNFGDVDEIEDYSPSGYYNFGLEGGLTCVSVLEGDLD